MDKDNFLVTGLKHLKIPLYSNSTFLIGNTFISSALGFFFWMIVAHYYTEAEVGWGSAIISAMLLFGSLAVLGFNITIIRFLSTARSAVKMINFFFTLSAIIATVIAVAFVAGLPIWSPAIGFVRENIVFSLVFVALVICLAFRALIDAVFVARRKAKFVFYRESIQQLLKLPLVVLMAVFFHAFGIAVSWGIPVVATVVISFLVFLPKVQDHYKPRPILNVRISSDIWRYSVGSYLAGIFKASPTLVLPIMVVNLLGPEQNAYFYITWLIASILYAIPWGVSRSLLAEGAHFKDELGVNVRRAIKYTFLLLVPAITMLFITGKWILLLFGINYSANGLLLLKILVLVGLLMGVNLIYFVILQVRSRLMEMVVASGFISIGTLLSSYFMLLTTGIVGIGYAWLVVQGIISVRAATTLLRLHRGM